MFRTIHLFGSGIVRNIDRATDIDVGVFGFDPYLADRVDAELADERDIPDVGLIFLFAAEDTAGLIIDRNSGVAGGVYPFRQGRSEERRVGNERVSKGSKRWAQE